MNIAKAETALSELPTGVVELKEFRYPVYLFVPSGYHKRKDRSMVLVIPGAKDSPESVVKSWKAIAKKRNLAVLAPEIRMRDGDVPYTTDTWLLNLKKTVAFRYGVRDVYLIGNDAKAHYAAYLGLKYPRQFSASALLGGSWIGPFEKLVKLSSRPRDQQPFFVALKPEDKQLAAAQEKTKALMAKGYAVQLVVLEREGEAAADSFRETLLDWCQKSHDAQLAKIQNSQKTLKEKLAAVAENFIDVQ